MSIKAQAQALTSQDAPWVTACALMGVSVKTPAIPSGDANKLASLDARLLSGLPYAGVPTSCAIF
jgi:hypothetical protein